MLKSIRRLFVSVLGAIVLSSCSGVPNRGVSEWSPVAIVDGRNHAAQDLVRSTLKRNNIECFMEGSVAYAVMVPKNWLKEAERALQEDPKLGPSIVKVLQNGRIPDSTKK